MTHLTPEAAQEVLDNLRKTDERFSKQIRDAATGDPECDHSMADAILCDAFRSLGMHKIVEAWESVGKWYA